MREQIFFNDEDMDRLLGVVMQLASEVYILKDRNLALEKWLESQNILPPDCLENQGAGLDAHSRDEFISRILGPALSGAQSSSNVDAEYRVS